MRVTGNRRKSRESECQITIQYVKNNDGTAIILDSLTQTAELRLGIKFLGLLIDRSRYTMGVYIKTTTSRRGTLKYAALILGLTTIAGCGGSDSDPAPVITYATLQVDSSDDDEDGEVTLTGLQSCVLDTDNKVFTGAWSGASGAALSVRITGFTTSADTNTCTQAADNTADDIGLKFEVCSVEFSTPDANGTASTYAMHRSESTQDGFTYAGTCTVSTTYDNKRVSGTISCTNMIQTKIRSTTRFPIDDSVVSTLSPTTEFFCDHQ